MQSRENDDRQMNGGDRRGERNPNEELETKREAKRGVGRLKRSFPSAPFVVAGLSHELGAWSDGVRCRSSPFGERTERRR